MLATAGAVAKPPRKVHQRGVPQRGRADGLPGGGDLHSVRRSLTTAATTSQARPSPMTITETWTACHGESERAFSLTMPGRVMGDEAPSTIAAARAPASFADGQRLCSFASEPLPLPLALPLPPLGRSFDCSPGCGGAFSCAAVTLAGSAAPAGAEEGILTFSSTERVRRTAQKDGRVRQPFCFSRTRRSVLKR